MMLKGFAILFLILIPFFIYSLRNKTDVSPKIIYFTPTPKPVSQSPSISSGISQQTEQNTSSPAPTAATPVQTAVPQNNISDFIYPGSAVLSQSSSALVLNSTDPAQTITDWYKNKIGQMGMNTTSLISTNTNDNISNKIVAGNNSKQIQIEIDKSSGSANVKISVSF